MIARVRRQCDVPHHHRLAPTPPLFYFIFVLLNAQGLVPAPYLKGAAENKNTAASEQCLSRADKQIKTLADSTAELT